MCMTYKMYSINHYQCNRIRGSLHFLLHEKVHHVIIIYVCNCIYIYICKINNAAQKLALFRLTNNIRF